MAEMDTTNRTWQIETLAELKSFRDRVNNGNGFANWTITLDNDIDISSESNWVPIGNVDCSFNGIFDGNGNTITGLTINNADLDYAGLFGFVDAGTVKNLTLENVSITAGDYVGAVAGYTNAEYGPCAFENITVTGNVQISGGAAVGGIIGGGDAVLNTVTINAAEGSLISGTAGDIGGIAGKIEADGKTYAAGEYQLSGLTSNINVTGSGNGVNSVGGIIGDIEGGLTVNGVTCSAGNVTAVGIAEADKDKVGGIVGSYGENVVLDEVSASVGSITGSYTDKDGVTQENTDTIKDNFFAGDSTTTITVNATTWTVPAGISGTLSYIDFSAAGVIFTGTDAAEITITETAAVDIEETVIGANGTLIADNCQNIDLGIITLDGTLSIDAASCVKGNTIEVGDTASIIIDAAGFESGALRLLDLNDDESLKGKVEVIVNDGDDLNVFYCPDGDLVLTDADFTNVYLIDTTGKVFGDKIEISETENAYVGINVLNQGTDAVNFTADYSASNIYINGEYTSDYWFSADITQDLAFYAYNEAETAALTASGTPYSGNILADFTVGAGVTIDIAPDRTTQNFALNVGGEDADNKTTWTIDGTFVFGGADFYFVEINVSKTGKFFSWGTDNTSFYEGSKLTVTGTGTAEAKMDDVQFRSGNYTSFSGAVTFDGTNVVIEGVSPASIGGAIFSGEAKSVITDSVLSVYIDADAADKVYNILTINKETEITDSDIYAGDLKIIDKDVTVRGGSINLAAGTGTAGDWSYNNTGALTIENAALDLTGVAIDAAGNVANNGAITMDSASTLVAESLTLGDTASITIDAAAFDGGAKKVIDLSGTESWKENEKVIIENLGDYKVAYNDEGDIVLHDADLTKIYVNSAWADSDPAAAGNQPYEFGATIAEGQYFGISAFTSVYDVLTEYADLASVNIYLTDDTAESFPGATIFGEFSINKDSEKESVAWDFDYTIGGAAGYTVTIGQGVIADGQALHSLHGATKVDGDVTVNSITAWDEGSWYGSDAPAEIIVSATGSLNTQSAYIHGGTLEVSGNVTDAFAEDLTSQLVVSGTTTLDTYNDAAPQIILSKTSAEFADITVSAESGLISITGSRVEASAVANNGTIAIDAASTLVADTLTLGDNAYITIDAAAFEGGAKKVIDLSGTESWKENEKVTVENLGDYKVAYNDEGDIVLHDADLTKIYVNSAYTGEFGEEVAAGHYLDINAFSSLYEAVSAYAYADPAVTNTIYIESDIDDSAVTDNRSFGGQLTLVNASGKESVNVIIPWDIGGQCGTTVTISEGINLTGDYLTSIEGYSVINGNATFNHIQGQYYTGKFFSEDGVFSEAAGITVSKTGTLTVLNGGSLMSGFLTVDGNGTSETPQINITGGLALTSTAMSEYRASEVSLKNTYAVIDSITVAEGSKFTVAGNSKLAVESMIGTIVAADGTTLTDSTIKGGTGYTSVETNGYKFLLSVNGDKAGTLNLKGENTLQNIDAGAGDKVNVTGTLHFVSNSDGFKLGNGATWQFNEAIVDGAWYLSLDGAYMTDDAAAPTSTLTANDSTFNLNQISAKGIRENQEIGYGTFTVNFNNSDVILANRFQIQEQETAKIDFNFVNGSSVEALNFINLSSKATVTFDTGSTAEFTQNFGNIGTVNVTNGAILTATYGTSGYGLKNDDSYVEKPNGNSGIINVTGAGLTLSGTKVFENSGTVTVSGASIFNAASGISGRVAFDNANVELNARFTGGYGKNNGVVFKGSNTVSGNFEASQVLVGDWFNSGYAGSVDFGADTSVKVNSQMIIGHDEGEAASSVVTFGDDENVSDKVFTAADVSVRTDGKLIIRNIEGDNKINTMNVMGDLVIDNAKLSGEAQIGSSDGEASVTIQNGAAVTWGGSSNSIVILGKGTGGKINVNNAELTIKRCGSGAGYTVPADTFVIGYNGGIGVLDLSKNAVFKTVDYNGDKDGGQVNVQISEGSSVNIKTGAAANISGSVINSGIITIDAASSLTAQTLTLGDNASITIDAEGFAGGVKKVIDLSGTESWKGNKKVIIDHLGDYKVAYNDEGDIVLHDADLSKLYVADTYTGEFGTEVTDGLYFGINAFTTFDAALDAANASTTEISVEGDVTLTKGYTYQTFPGDIKVTSVNGATITGDVNFGPGYRGSCSMTFAENVTLNIASVYAWEDTLEINGKADLGYLWNYGYWKNYPDTKLIINETAKVTVSTQLALRGGDFIVNGTITDTAAALGKAEIVQLDASSAYGDWGGNSGYPVKAYLNNTYVTFAQGTIGGTGTWPTYEDGNTCITILDNSILEFGNYVTVASQGKVQVTNDSILSIKCTDGFSSTNKGVIEISGSTLNVDGLLTNNGTIDVSGESTLNINTLDGKQMLGETEVATAITLKDGAVISDSTIGGNVYVAGKVTFRGENTFANIRDFGPQYYFVGNNEINNREWTVEEGASVELTASGKLGFGYGDKVFINGGLTDAATAFETDLTKDDASLIVAGGIIAQSAREAESTFTIDSAYVRIGMESYDKSFNNDNAGDNKGTYKFVWNNAVVEARSFEFENSANGTYNFDLTDSVFHVGILNQKNEMRGSFIFNDADSTFTATDSTIISAGEYGTVSNSGEIILNGSNFNSSNDFVNNGKITMDSDSTLVAESLTLGENSSVIIDVTNFEGGAKKVIDLNGTESLEGKVTIDGDYNVAYAADGDVIIHDADMSELFVNPDWADSDPVAAGNQPYEFGETIANDLYSGINAFSSVNKAVAAVTEETAYITVAQGESAVLSKSVSTENPDGLIINMGNNGVFAGPDGFTESEVESYIQVGGAMTIGENVTVNADYIFDYALSGDFVINGTVNVNSVINQGIGAGFIVNGILNCGDAGNIYMACANASMTVNGKVTAAEIYYDDNCYGGELTVAEDGIVETTDLFIRGDRSVDVQGSLTASGDVDVDELNVGGTLEIALGNTVTIGSLTGDGEIAVDASTFNGGTSKLIDFTGDISGFAGDITVNAPEDSQVTVFEGEDGDVFITDATRDVIYVNEDYAGKEFGTVVNGNTVGFNAFGDIVSAIQSAAADAKVSSIVVEKGESSYLYAYIQNSITSENEEGLVIDMGNNNISWHWDYIDMTTGELAADDAISSEILNSYYDFTIGKNVTVKCDVIAGVSYGKYLIEGTAETNAAFMQGMDLAVDGTLTVYDWLTLSSMNGTGENTTINEGGKINAENADITSGYTFNIDGTANIVNIESEGSIAIGKNGILSITGDADISEIAVDGILNIAPGNDVTIGNLTGEGTIKVDASEFNGGTSNIFSITGDISNFDGEIQVDVADGYTTFESTNGDLFITNASKATLYVLSDYKNYAFGSPVTDDPDKVVGFNAFVNVNSAVAAATDETAEIIVTAGKNAELSRSVITENEKGLDVSMGGSGYSYNANGTFKSNGAAWRHAIDISQGDAVFGANVTITADTLKVADTLGIEGDVTVTGANVVNGTIDLTGKLTVNDRMVITGSSAITVRAGAEFSAEYVNCYDTADARFQIDGKAVVTNIQIDGTVAIGAKGSLDLSNGDIDNILNVGTITLENDKLSAGTVNLQYGSYELGGFKSSTEDREISITFIKEGATSEDKGITITTILKAGETTVQGYVTSQINGYITEGNYEVTAVDTANTYAVAGTVSVAQGKFNMDIYSQFAFENFYGQITLDATGWEYNVGDVIIDHKTGMDLAGYKALISNWDDVADYLEVDANGDLIVKADSAAVVDNVINDQHSYENLAKDFDLIITDNVEVTTDNYVGHYGADAEIRNGTFNATVSGGYVVDNTTDTATVIENADTDMLITGGDFNRLVIGAERVNSGTTNRIDSNVSTTITGGEFEYQVFGGSYYAGTDIFDGANIKGNIELNILGGSFNKIIYGGSGAAKAYSGMTAIQGDITVTVDTTELADDAKIVFGNSIVAGSYGSGTVIGKTQVIFTGAAGKISFADDFQVWGGSSGDVYNIAADGTRTFESTITRRTFTFDGFTGLFDGRIRGFNFFEMTNGSDVELGSDVNLSDITNWELEVGSELSGSFVNDFTGDNIVIDVTDWADDVDSYALISGSADTFKGLDLTKVEIVGGAAADFVLDDDTADGVFTISKKNQGQLA